MNSNNWSFSEYEEMMTYTPNVNKYNSYPVRKRLEKAEGQDIIIFYHEGIVF